MIFSKDNATTLQEAKAFAEAYLNKEGFCSSGRFNDGPGDYFDVYQKPGGSCWPEDIPYKILDVITNQPIQMITKETLEDINSINTPQILVNSN